MRVELPEFKRCCCCLPLRYGLIFWGYLKMILVSASWMLVFYSIFIKSHTDVPNLLIMFHNTADIVFSVVLVIASHTKNMRLLKVFYFYSIGETALAFLVVLGLISWILFMIFSGESGPLWLLVLYYSVPIFALMIVCLVIQCYVILLVRSELTKLQQHQNQFMFVNNAAEAEAACVLVVNAKEKDVSEVDINVHM